MKRAFVAARNRPGGVCLGLQRLGINIWWQGKGGMVWLDMYKKIKTLLKVNDKPQYLILHSGANDVGSSPLKSLIQNIKTSLGKIQLLLPNTKIIWSQLPPGAGRRPSGLSVHTLRRWANLAHPSFATFSHYINIVVKGSLLSPLSLKCVSNEHLGNIRGT